MEEDFEGILLCKRSKVRLTDNFEEVSVIATVEPSSSSEKRRVGKDLKAFLARLINPHLKEKPVRVFEANEIISQAKLFHQPQPADLVLSSSFEKNPKKPRTRSSRRHKIRTRRQREKPRKFIRKFRA